MTTVLNIDAFQNAVLSISNQQTTKTDIVQHCSQLLNKFISKTHGKNVGYIKYQNVQPLLA